MIHEQIGMSFKYVQETKAHHPHTVLHMLKMLITYLLEPLYAYTNVVIQPQTLACRTHAWVPLIKVGKRYPCRSRNLPALIPRDHIVELLAACVHTCLKWSRGGNTISSCGRGRFQRSARSCRAANHVDAHISVEPKVLTGAAYRRIPLIEIGERNAV